MKIDINIIYIKLLSYLLKLQNLIYNNNNNNNIYERFSLFVSINKASN